MSPDERLQRIANRNVKGGLPTPPEDVGWLIEQVIRLNSENARQTNKIIAIREMIDEAEYRAARHGVSSTISTEWLRARLGPR